MQRSDRLNEYLKSQRQWKRYQRIGHAKFMIKNCPDDAAFWRSVLKANQWTPYDSKAHS